MSGSGDFQYNFRSLLNANSIPLTVQMRLKTFVPPRETGWKNFPKQAGSIQYQGERSVANLLSLELW